MASVQAVCLKFVFSIILVTVLAKVSSIADATDTAPSEFIADVFDPKSIEETENADDSTSHFAARELGDTATPKKSKKTTAKEGIKYAVGKAKEGTMYVVKKTGEAYNKHIGSRINKGKNGKPAPAPKAAAATAT